MKTLEYCKQYWNISQVSQAFGNAYVLTVSADETAYHQFIDTLTVAGFTEYTSREEDRNHFAVYTKTSEKLFISYFDFREEIRIVVEASNTPLPPRSEDQTEPMITTPFVTQVKLAYCQADCGMTYIIRLSDGRFVVIDGGYDEYEEADRLFDTLHSQNVREKITVAAWIITHPHGDHYLCFMKFWNKYGDRVSLQHLLYNWPLPELCKYPCNTEDYDKFVETLPCQIIIPRTGQRFCYGDAVFDVFFACEDLYPNVIRNTNDSSLVFRMNLGGKRFLWLADAEFVSCEEICRSFSARSLKCDFLQVGHHGYDGGSPELYRRADPETLLWPCPDFWYHVVRTWKSNDFLRNSTNIKHIFVEGHDTTVLDMRLTDPAAAADQTSEKTPLHYSQEFHSINRIVDLGWSCITGGDTGYAPAHLSLSDDGCHIARLDGRAVCQLLYPEMLKNTPNYTLHIEGKKMSAKGRIGLIFNDENPTVWNEEKVLWLKDNEGEFCYSLSLDSKTQQGVLNHDSAQLQCFSYSPVPGRGLYLVVENESIILKKISLKGE